MPFFGLQCNLLIAKGVCERDARVVTIFSTLHGPRNMTQRSRAQHETTDHITAARSASHRVTLHHNATHHITSHHMTTHHNTSLNDVIAQHTMRHPQIQAVQLMAGLPAAWGKPNERWQPRPVSKRIGYFREDHQHHRHQYHHHSLHTHASAAATPPQLSHQTGQLASSAATQAPYPRPSHPNFGTGLNRWARRDKPPALRPQRGNLT